MMTFKTFVKRNDFITEAAKNTMLDVSIANADKSFKDKIDFFLHLNEKGSPVSGKKYSIEEKTDGVKLTLFRNNKDFNSKDFTDNWIVAYKNYIMHPSEFKSVTPKKAKEQGIGVSQYKLVFDHLKKIHKNLESIPKNTEFFIEFLMTKSTLTRTYENKHGMILIGYAHNVKIDQQDDFRLYTKDTKLNQTQNEHYAELLKLDLPLKIFEGEVGSFTDLRTGANTEFKKILRKNKNDFEKYYKLRQWDELYELFKESLLTTSSHYGGKMEGVVIKDLDSKKMFKFLQSDQHDKEIRAEVKQKYAMDKDEENQYFNILKQIGNEILSEISLSETHENIMAEISQAVHKRKLPKNLHTKKNDHQIKEDLHLTVKNLYEKVLKGWAGVVGKFRIVTNEHVNMIKYALKKYKGVSVMIVVGKRDVLLAEENRKILMDIFKGEPVEFFISQTGNIVSLERKTRNPIVAYVCGPDREDDYRNQLKNANNDSVVDVYNSGKRDDVSASKAEEALNKNDAQTLKRIVHPTALKFIDKWSKYY